MALSVYYLSIYPILDNILDKISKCARKLLWANYGNGSGVPLVNWHDAMLDKPDGGIKFRNLRLAKISLIAKNVLNYLNSKQIFWVDILISKYGMLKLYHHNIPTNATWFYRGLCKVANEIKSCL